MSSAFILSILPQVLRLPPEHARQKFYLEIIDALSFLRLDVDKLHISGITIPYKRDLCIF